MKKLDDPFRALTADEKAQREIRVVPAPERRLRLHIRQGTDASGLGDVARFGQVIREPVPREVRPLDSGPHGEKKESGEREPGRFESRRRVAARQAHGPARHSEERENPAPPPEQQKRRETRQRRDAENARLAEEKNERARGHGSDREHRVEIAVRRLRAREHPKDRVAQQRRHAEDRGRDQRGRRVPGEDHHRQSHGGERGGGDPRPSAQRESEKKEHGEAAENDRDEEDARARPEQLVGVAAHERLRSEQEEAGREGDEGATGPGACAL